MKPFLLLFLLACGGLCVFCGRESGGNESEHATTIERIDFTAPPDSAVSVEQLRRWIACDRLLDSLSRAYRDSFAVDDPAARLAFQEAFIRAQDSLCVTAGLSGGYDEYRWILRHAGLPRNSAALESLGVDSF